MSSAPPALRDEPRRLTRSSPPERAAVALQPVTSARFYRLRLLALSRGAPYCLLKSSQRRGALVNDKQIMEDFSLNLLTVVLFVTSPRPFLPRGNSHCTDHNSPPPPIDGMDLDLNFTSLKSGPLSSGRGVGGAFLFQGS